LFEYIDKLIIFVVSIPFLLSIFFGKKNKKKFLLVILIWLIGLGPIFAGLFSDRTPFQNASIYSINENHITIIINQVVLILVLSISLMIIIEKILDSHKAEKKIIDISSIRLISSNLIMNSLFVISSFFAVIPGIDFRQLYLPIVFLALIFSLPINPVYFCKNIRNILLLIVIGSLLTLIISNENAIIQTKSYISFIDFRYFGITYHPNALGILSTLAIFFVVIFPPKNKSFTIISLLISVFTLVLTQSKTSWIIFIICSFILIFYKIFTKKDKIKKRLFILGIITIFSIMIIWLVFDKKFMDFISVFLSDDLFTTLSGRLAIWEISLNTFRSNPIFGYGFYLWDRNFQIFTGSLGVGHSHNQFMQSLAQTGITGFLGLTIYYMNLIFFGFKAGRVSNGLSVVLVILLILRSFTETPMRSVSIDNGFFIHFIIFSLIVVFNQKFLFERKEKIKEIVSCDN